MTWLSKQRGKKYYMHIMVKKNYCKQMIYQFSYWILFRFDLVLGQGTCSTFPQFCLQLGGSCVAYIIIQSSLSSQHTQHLLDQFSFYILALSCAGHLISLTATQYYALMIQHDNGISYGQKYSTHLCHSEAL